MYGWKFHFIYIIDPTCFHAYVVILVGLLWLLSNICCLTYIFVCGLIHMQLYESCWRCGVGLTITLNCQLIYFPTFDASSLVCSLLSWAPIYVAKGCTHLTPHVLEPVIRLPWLTASVTPLLLTELSYLSLRHCGQGIILWPTTGTPTPNSLRSNWDFLPGRSPWHVGGSNTVNTRVDKF